MAHGGLGWKCSTKSDACRDFATLHTRLSSCRWCKKQKIMKKIIEVRPYTCCSCICRADGLRCPVQAASKKRCRSPEPAVACTRARGRSASPERLRGLHGPVPRRSTSLEPERAPAAKRVRTAVDTEYLWRLWDEVTPRSPAYWPTSPYAKSPVFKLWPICACDAGPEPEWPQYVVDWQYRQERQYSPTYPCNGGEDAVWSMP